MQVQVQQLQECLDVVDTFLKERAMELSPSKPTVLPFIEAFGGFLPICAETAQLNSVCPAIPRKFIYTAPLHGLAIGLHA